MRIEFFLKLKSHKLPVSIKEHLTLLEAMDKGVIRLSVDDFYYLSRIALVKDEANLDEFDRAFAEFWQGVETVPGIEAQAPRHPPDDRRRRRGAEEQRLAWA